MAADLPLAGLIVRVKSSGSLFSWPTPAPTQSTPMPVIRSIEELEALYGQPTEAAIVKEVDRITSHYRQLIEASPFLVLATSGPEGLDCSPRGDRPGFVRIADERTLMLPDRRGDNRGEKLPNI